jgi:hypothetical protein
MTASVLISVIANAQTRCHRWIVGLSVHGVFVVEPAVMFA